MKLTSSQEEYLKTIYVLQKNNEKVRVTDIAKKMDITKPSVNKAINILKDMELLNYETYGDITLTKQGEDIAKDVLKRQDILKLFLTEVLEVEKDLAEEDAQAMKHAVSKETIKKLDKYITKVLNLEELNCRYDSDNEKCRNCIKVAAKNRLKNNGGKKC